MGKESLLPAVAGIVIAGGSLALSIQQMSADHEFRRLSVRPQLFLKFDWWGHFETDETVNFKLTLFNRGLGPARLRRWAICLDGRSMGSITGLAEEIETRLDSDLGCESIPSHHAFRYNPVLNNGEEIKILNIKNICARRVSEHRKCDEDSSGAGCAGLNGESEAAFRGELVDSIKSSLIDKIQIKLEYESMFGEVDQTEIVPSTSEQQPFACRVDWHGAL